MDSPDLENTRELELRRFRHNVLSHEGVQALFAVCLARNAAAARMRRRNAKKPAKPDAGSAGTLEKPDLNHLLQGRITLPSLPHIFSRLIELMSDERSSTDDFARVILQDPALSARLLKIVNSPFYGFRAEIGTVSQAVAIIGVNDLYALCLGTSVVNAFRTIPIELVDMPSFWKHSIACGIIARVIAENKGFPNRERFFVAGLLHDLGRLILYRHLADHAQAALHFAARYSLLLHHAETEILGFDHARMGGMLMKKWKLPGELEQMIRYHHSPEHSAYPVETAVIHLADVIANALETGTSGETFVPQMDPLAWRQVDMPLPLLKTIAEQIDSRITEITDLLVPEQIGT
ncbi:MAG: HDOD domain-containing protein [Thermodesulfobacteriota bacterium]